MRRYAVLCGDIADRSGPALDPPGFEFRSENFTNQVKTQHRRRRLAAIAIVTTFSMLFLVLAGAGAAFRRGEFLLHIGHGLLAQRSWGLAVPCLGPARSRRHMQTKKVSELKSLELGNNKLSMTSSMDAQREGNI